MGVLTHGQADALNRALLHLHEPEEAGSFSDHVFEAARMLVPYETAGLSVHDLKTNECNAILNAPLHDLFAKSQKYSADMHALPCFASGDFFSTGSPVSLLDFMSEDFFKGTSIYEFFYKDMDVLHETTLNYHAHENRFFFQLNLARKKWRFTSEERQLLGYFQSHLSQRCRHLLSTGTRDPFFLQSPCSDAQIWLVCNHSGRILNYSTGLPVLFRNLNIPFNSQIPREWKEWMLRAMLSPRGGSAPLLLGTNGSPRFVVNFHPNRLSGEHFLILQPLVDPRHTLTRREREIARWLSAGKTNWEIGEILQISRLTVKTHIHNILAKLGAENRTAAANLLASGEFSDFEKNQSR